MLQTIRLKTSILRARMCLPRIDGLLHTGCVGSVVAGTVGAQMLVLPVLP
jgi:hypothetical protein